MLAGKISVQRSDEVGTDLMLQGQYPKKGFQRAIAATCLEEQPAVRPPIALCYLASQPYVPKGVAITGHETMSKLSEQQEEFENSSIIWWRFQQPPASLITLNYILPLEELEINHRCKGDLVWQTCERSIFGYIEAWLFTVYTSEALALETSVILLISQASEPIHQIP
ncbi:hypothetical protein H6P81_017246 [Aristolochia fimbriata]|uniref:Uncharacterized protein n=1 Tax=Aristolochia fimbriata TaxID=158543 RepID=A0AAV7E0M2_ARIFI|nr:hypothetical protein H6P81_017246 [Aristolochia fimbriata]